MKSKELIIEAGKGNRQYFKDIWYYRELFYFLAWRDILVRYKQTLIGICWAVIRPLAMVVAFTIVFGKLAKMPTEGNAPYAIMVLAGLLPWQFFASALSDSSNSVIVNTNMVSKIYFPRIIIPSSAAIVCVVDFLISLTILVGMMCYYQYLPTWRIFALPLFASIAFMAALGAGLWFSSLNVRFRDFRYVVPFIVQFGLYISPVGFSSSVVPDKWRVLYSFNPMTGVIEGFRWAVLGGRSNIYWQGFSISVALVFFLFISGFWYFRKVERSFADFI